MFLCFSYCLREETAFHLEGGRGGGVTSVFVRDYMEYIQEIAVVRPGLFASWSME